MQVKRKDVESYTQMFLEGVSIQDKDAYYDVVLQKQMQRVINYNTQNWVNPEKAVLFLLEIPFFKRLRKYLSI